MSTHTVSQSAPVTMPTCESTDRDFRTGFFAAWAIHTNLGAFMQCSKGGLWSLAMSRYQMAFGVERAEAWRNGFRAYQAARTGASL